jgi:alkylated DNA repair dioxygenase AlkB
MSAPGQLFGADVPPGFDYQDDFISVAEEADLVDHMNRVEFANFEMHGVVAKRRVAFFGASYDRPSTLDARSESTRRSLRTGGDGPSPPIPEFLFDVRARLAAWAGVAPERFAMALINEYREGSPIGWHRDAPQYELIAGLSLLSPCRMRLRPYLSPKEAARTTTRRVTTHEIELRPRSAYIISAEARSKYEHSIPAVAELRYSITFRTLR